MPVGEPVKPATPTGLPGTVPGLVELANPETPTPSGESVPPNVPVVCPLVDAARPPTPVPVGEAVKPATPAGLPTVVLGLVEAANPPTPTPSGERAIPTVPLVEPLSAVAAPWIPAPTVDSVVTAKAGVPLGPGGLLAREVIELPVFG